MIESVPSPVLLVPLLRMPAQSKSHLQGSSTTNDRICAITSINGTVTLCLHKSPVPVLISLPLPSVLMSLRL